MFDIKGLPVQGYKDQSQPNVDLVNRNKKIEELVLKVIDELEVVSDIDRRWLAIAKTDLEKGFMAMNRSIFKPSRAKLLPEDKLNVNSLVIEVKLLSDENAENKA